MNPIVVASVVGATTTLARWSDGKGLTIDTVVGVTVLAVILTLIEQANPRLAGIFGWLVLVGVSAYHAPKILKATGLVKE